MKPQRVDTMPLATVHRRGGVSAEGGDGLDAGRLRRPIAEVRQRDPMASTVEIHAGHGEDALGFRVGQGLEQDAVHDPEDRRRRADAESEHGNGSQGEPWRSRQQAQAVTAGR